MSEKCEIRKKAGHSNLSEKRESGLAFENQDFSPETGNVDTYVVIRNG